MGIRVKLAKVIDEMDMQSDELSVYLNKKTGEFVLVADSELWADEGLDIKIAEEVLDDDDFISLPSKFDIHEWEIMRRFCGTVEDPSLQDELYDAIHGRGAFRMFKNTIRRHGIQDDWYAYRDGKIRQIAIDWCEQNGIEYEE